MTTALATQQAPQGDLTPDRVDRGLELLRHSLPSLRECPESRQVAELSVAALSKPAHPAKVMVRVLALLHPYFDKETVQAAREVEAEDWAVALQGYPYWAIERACRWWKLCKDTRNKRPKEGDIVDRCRVEMDAVNAAKLALAAKPTTRSAPAERTPLTEDKRAERKRQLYQLQSNIADKLEAGA